MTPILLRALSVGCAIDAWHVGTGVVHSVFDHAVNVLIGDDLWTVLPRPRLETPFGLRLAAWPERIQSVAPVGGRVHVRAGYVRIGAAVIDCRTATRWSPSPIRPTREPLGASLAFLERRARPRAWCGSPAVADDLANALRGFSSGRTLDAVCAVRRIVGRGPGLTPSGDDVLAGAITLLASGTAGPAGDRAWAWLASIVSRMWHTTSDISRHLLTQAVRGLPGRGLHDLIKSLLEGAPVEVLGDALDSALSMGATSGADACLGVVAACRYAWLGERPAA